MVTEVVQRVRRRFYDSHANLPLDPDSELAYKPRPMHTDWAHIAVVAFGAFFGTYARYLVEAWLPSDTSSWPRAIFLVNLVGAFTLGLLLQMLLYRGKDNGRRRIARLMFGTGFLGSFTTYSSLAVGATLLVHGGDMVIALSYATVSVVAGLILCVCGIWSATAIEKNLRRDHA